MAENNLTEKAGEVLYCLCVALIIKNAGAMWQATHWAYLPARTTFTLKASSSAASVRMMASDILCASKAMQWVHAGWKSKAFSPQLTAMPREAAGSSPLSVGQLFAVASQVICQAMMGNF